MELEEFLDQIDKKRVKLSSLEKARPRTTQTLCGWAAMSWSICFVTDQQAEDRNKKLFMAGVYSRLKHTDDWKQQMETMNHQLFTTPLDAKEMLALQKSLERKEYFYTCEQEPFKSYCDKELCISRRYGIGDDTEQAVNIGNLLIQLSEPRLYFLTVQGENGSRLTLNSYRTRRSFNVRVLNRYRLPLRS